MNYTTKIYTSIKEDIQSRENCPGSNASRMSEYANGIKLVFSIEIASMRREAYISLDDLPEGIRFPNWRGIFIDIAQLPVYGSDTYYVRFVQLPESEDYIFDIVIEDLRQAVVRLLDSQNCINTVIDILIKWKRFFQSEKSLVMTDELQEGLYGELTFLEKAIASLGTSAVANWVGGEKETHDFYFSSNAVEIKTTSRKEPYSVLITSEYQLDSKDVAGRLFLYAVALRKSKQSGEQLPEIISRIRDRLIGDSSMKVRFNDKLLQYGYIDGIEEQYVTGFYIRDIYVYEVTGEFPKIIRTMFPIGVSKVVYELSLSHCTSYICSEEQLIRALRGGRVYDQ
ncbi:PD-(D/E)XK motif protein [[Clostridium] symbiosum]|uniref:PD-(D/E)XK motif protein n=1 Tax=Clostridium symbiosum TaxID=1512 RepID=UPI00210BA020|nr:PD-(D/E)XK motif protein [[Clostridium] symbiosum]MCQ4833622.1 PD-(D/E)XK motif protein [[Clostridium] symbiosum]